MREAAADERFEDAARYRNRLHAVERLAERQAVERASIGTIDVIGLAVGGRARGRAGVPAAGRPDGRPLLVPPRERGRRRPLEVLEGFCLEYYGAAPSIPPQILVPRGLGDLTTLEGFLSELRGSRVEVRGARARREAAAAGARAAERRAGAVVGDARLRDEAAAARRGARGAARGAEPRVAADPDRVLRHLEHPGPGDRRLDGRVRGRPREEGALPQVRACAGRPGRTTSRRWPRSCRARFARLAAGHDTDDYDESFAATPNLVVIDGGKGQLSAALEAMEAYDLPRVAVVVAREARRGGLPAGPLRTPCCSPTTRRGCS